MCAICGMMPGYVLRTGRLNLRPLLLVLILIVTVYTSLGMFHTLHIGLNLL